MLIKMLDEVKKNKYFKQMDQLHKWHLLPVVISFIHNLLSPLHY